MGLIVLIILLVVGSLRNNGEAAGLKGMFIFGSSEVDNGNNNHLFGDFAKANHMPYGVDFMLGPTGRFTNGKTFADLITEHLQLPFIPLFDAHTLRISGDSFMQGVNFASAASGILDATGIFLGIQSMDSQIKNFKDHIVPQLETRIGTKSVKILPDYLFLVGAGNYDYISYHLLHQDIIWSPMSFAAKLINALSTQIKTLYDLGARRFLVLSVYPVGCNPVLTRNKANCLDELNTAAQIYHEQLLIMVRHKYQQMPEAQFSVVNSAKIIMDLITNPGASGFMNVDFPCCETTVKGTCKRESKVCLPRDKYVYFDGLHLTEAANAILANKAYASTDPDEVFPVNLQQLLQF